MHFPKYLLTLVVLGSISTGCQTAGVPVDEQNAQTATTKASPLPFAWPFLERAEMVARGGTTTGSDVTLATEPSAEWKALQEDGLSSLEQDRRAILAMVGNYRTGFQFVETGGFVDGYEPPRPYFSWGTEHVMLLEDRGEFISLQHTLVMYMEDKDGSVMGPFVMKHWRQDWSYEKDAIHTYQGNRIWEQETLAPEQVSGTWVQSVFQVDDSPRYEVIGRWKHGEQYSSWISEASFRPLPRREHSVRSDYNILEGEHRITISPTGWIHEQHNRKVSRSGGTDTYLAQEIGFTRYERISDPDLSAAEESWKKEGDYWASVRNTWKTIFAEHTRFQIKATYEDAPLWQFHFGHAGEIEQADSYDAAKWGQEAKDTIYRFLNTGEAIEVEEGY